MGYRCANCNQPLFLGSLLEPKDARIAALGAERDALAARVAALHNHLRELCEVAHLRGDDNLPHPADDPRMWTARMQTAWDEANTLLDSTPAADLEAHDARVRREEREGFRCAPDGYVHCVEAPPDLRPLAEEMVRARTKFPGPRVLGSALAEEVGEMADAWLRMDPTHCRKEALQVACVAMRIHQEGNVGIGESMEILKLMAALEAPARAYLGATGLGPDTSAPEAREDSPRHANGHAASCPFDGMGSAGFMECTCGGPEAQDNGQEGK